MNNKYEFREPNETANVCLNLGTEEMIRVTRDGFYIRGQRVPVDDNEAQTVYNAFKEFLTWAAINRQS